MARDQVIRSATAADWAQIWPFWRDIVETGETYAYPSGTTSEEARAWWMDGATVVVLEEDGEVVGTARMGPNRPGRGDHVGTAAFMVSSVARGHGVGRRLAEYVVAWHRDQGFEAIQFNAVVETNYNAVALWQSLGFEVIGTVPRAFRSRTHGHVGMHIMWLDLRENKNVF